MNSERYKIRHGQTTDIALLPAIEAKAAKLYLSVLEETGLTANILERTSTIADFSMAQAAGLLFVAVDDSNAPVGFALLEEIDEWLHLDELDVEPEYGRKGIGAALLAQVCTWAAKAGYSGVTLSTFRNVAWNAPFYAKRGFVILEEEMWTPGLRTQVNEERLRGLQTDRRVVMLYRC